MFTAVHTLCLAGASCLNVVDKVMGGTTAYEFHCSGSWPTCIAFVANPGCCCKKPSSDII